MSPNDFHVLKVRDAEGDVGEAVVDCPRRKTWLPLLVCEQCPECVHVSRASNIEDWVVVCIAKNEPN